MPTYMDVGGFVGILADLSEKLVSGAIQSTAQGLLSPITREATYAGNFSWTNTEVTPEIGADLFHRDLVSETELKYVFNLYGMEYEQPDDDGTMGFRNYCWRQWVELTRPHISLDSGVDFWRRGVLDINGVERLLNHYGIKDAAEQNAILRVRTPIGVDQVRARVQAGNMTSAEAVAEIGLAGFGAPGDVGRALGYTAIPSSVQAVALWYRGEISLDVRQGMLDYNGASNDELKRQQVILATPIPGPADLVRFAVREGWDQQVVNRWGYDAEYPLEFDAWMTAQGLGTPFPVNYVGGGQVPPIPWAKMYWRSHWQPMSPTQAADAYNRINAATIDRLRERFPDLQVFTDEHFRDVLKIADYPPAVRDWLQALSVPRMDKRDLRQLYVSGVRDWDWAYAQLSAFGHTNAALLDIKARWDYDKDHAESAVQRSVEARTARAIIDEIQEGYADGWLSKAEATSRLNAHALPAQVISDMLDVVDGKKARAYLRDFVKRVKADYLGGAMTPQEVLVRLVGAAIVPDEAQRLLTRWTLLATTKRRALASGQIISLAKQGILSPAAASARLANLGWVQGDIALQVLSIQRQLTIGQQRALQAQGRARVAARKQLAQSARQAGGLRRQAVAALRQMYPKAELRRWLNEGIVNAAYVAARLREQQRSPDYIDKFLRDAGFVKPTKASKAKAPEAPPPA